ncbi:MAG: ribonuclease HII [Acidimicrobiales bacterium]
MMVPHEAPRKGTSEVSSSALPERVAGEAVRAPTHRRDPDLTRERLVWRAGHDLVAGVDEVGRGAWAGPLSVGVAIVKAGVRGFPAGLRDSKQISEARREELFDPVSAWCAAWAVGHASPEECDSLGMNQALRVAAGRALAAIAPPHMPGVFLVDGDLDFVGPTEGEWEHEVQLLVGGDAICASIAAASVLAKVTRDRIMRDLAGSYPGFDFDRNKGYPSPAHRAALGRDGLTPIHRASWSYVERIQPGPNRLVRDPSAGRGRARR